MSSNSKFLLLSLLLSSVAITKAMDYSEENNSDEVVLKKDNRNKKGEKKSESKKSLTRKFDSVDSKITTALYSTNPKEIAGIISALKKIKKNTNDNNLSSKAEQSISLISSHLNNIMREKDEIKTETLVIPNQEKTGSEISEIIDMKENIDSKSEEPEEDLTSSIRLIEDMSSKLKELKQNKDTGKIEKLEKQEKENLIKLSKQIAEKKKEKENSLMQDKEKIEKLNKELEEAKKEMKSKEESLKNINKNVEKFTKDARSIKTFEVDEFIETLSPKSETKATTPGQCNLI